MPFPKFQNPTPANPANLLNREQEPRPARKDEDSQDLLIAAKLANPSAKPEPTPPEGGEFSKPISRFSTTLAESRGEDFSSPGQGKPEEFSRLATLADLQIQQPTLPMGWAYLLEQAEPLAARLVELGAPVLRLDVERIARGYQSIEGMDFEEVAKLLRWLLEAVAREYPEADNIHVIAQWPGKWPEKTRNEVLEAWESVTL